MADCYLGEIRMCGLNFAPRGWAFCNGQLLSISQYDALFVLIGTTFGGDGVNTFALPNIQGRRLVGTGPGYVLGQTAGTEAHTLLISEMPTHTHAFSASDAPGTQPTPQNGFPAASAVDATYSATSQSSQASPVSTTGGTQPHENRPPYLVVNFIMALEGIFPSSN